MRRAVLVGLAAVLILATAGCGASPEPAVSPTPSPTPTASARAPVMAFLVSGQMVVPVRRYALSDDPTQRLIAAVEALLEGPTPAEAEAGLTTAIPAGARLRGLSVGSSAIMVDLSGEYASGGGSFSVAARLAQLVFTVTQIDLGTQVSLLVDGATPVVFSGEGVVVDHPVGRDAYEQWSPAILILSPLTGDSVASPVRVSGTANVFEALFSVDLVAGGQTTTVPVHAVSGTGTRGGFAGSIDAGGYRGPARLVPWYASPKDGSRVESPAVTVVIG